MGGSPEWRHGVIHQKLTLDVYNCQYGKKIIESEIYILSRENPRVAVRADISIENKRLHVLNTHLVHTHQQESKEQNEQVSNLIKLLTTKWTILMGDFNAIPDSSAITNIKKVLLDSDPASLPTWSMYPDGCIKCNPQEVNTRLDYIFTSNDIKTGSFKVEKSNASDHLPISVTLEI
ncbi:endonuclease/exonuclease/phosphatase family protein [Candidatus Curtissbacteria bacterium]|nr:endonuclease/exonuclease/phosphatase family protein [Candidatus Curtissbacteria bacterium]